MNKRGRLLIISALCWHAVDISLVLVVPIYGAMFADHDQFPPLLTRACMDLASFRHDSVFYTPLFYGGLIGSVMLAVKEERKRFAMGFVACSLLAFGLFALALVMPAVA